METLVIGDRVRVVADVWDDSREKSWQGWEGIIEDIEHPKSGPYPVFVFFPKARGKYRRYDFLPEELERIV